MSQFSVKGDKESKLRFAFRIYDMDNDGYISNGELFQVFGLHVFICLLWFILVQYQTASSKSILFYHIQTPLVLKVKLLSRIYSGHIKECLGPKFQNSELQL